MTDTVPKRRLSLFRLVIAGGLIYGGIMLSQQKWQAYQDKKVTTDKKPWFASYVDVTSTPRFAFEQLGSTPTPHVVLSFIVPSASDGCAPTWGNAFSLDDAGVNLDLDRRIARLRQQGGEVSISFGGLLNSELAVTCHDEDKLQAAYESVISRYTVDTIDLDLEGPGLTDKEAVTRRAHVIAALQTKVRSDGKQLAVWLTLPVAPFGLSPEGTNAVAEMLRAKVDIAGINVMTMDYGASKVATESMESASEKALTETVRQVGILYKQAGINLSNMTLWSKLGATPMIGQNDNSDEIFSLDDAKGLNAFATSHGVMRMSMWSANRDIQCGENYVDTKVVSDSCSGIKQNTHAFADALGKDFTGNLSQNASTVTREDASPEAIAEDDPSKSPYQIWQKSGAYLQGTKVVWHGNVYQAKWWTQGNLPDNPVLQAWETPWQLVGPVLPGEKPLPIPALPKGTYPTWNGADTFNTGDRVLFQGVPYQAKWWTQGDSPAAASSNADSSPWVPLTLEQVNAVIDKLNAAKDVTPSPTPRPRKSPVPSVSPSPVPSAS